MCVYVCTINCAALHDCISLTCVNCNFRAQYNFSRVPAIMTVYDKKMTGQATCLPVVPMVLCFPSNFTLCNVSRAQYNFSWLPGIVRPKCPRPRLLGQYQIIEQSLGLFSNYSGSPHINGTSVYEIYYYFGIYIIYIWYVCHWPYVLI